MIFFRLEMRDRLVAIVGNRNFRMEMKSMKRSMHKLRFDSKKYNGFISLSFDFLEDEGSNFVAFLEYRECDKLMAFPFWNYFGHFYRLFWRTKLLIGGLS